MKQPLPLNVVYGIPSVLTLAAALAAASSAFAFDIEGDANSHRFSNGEKTVLSFTQDGSLTVTGSGTVELLVVGGGGGGGELGSVADQSGIKVAGGGGAGGLVHKATFAVSAGTYAVTVGAGGAIGANGGNSSVFSVTAYGGGYGARGGTGERRGGDGGSGGGSNSGWTAVVAGGSAIYGDEDNLGHDGSKAENRFCQGGGGGAGSSPTKKVKRNSYDTVLDIDDTSSDGIAYGGDGLAFDITGSEVYYAGGGAAYNSYGTMRSMGGKGGGGRGNTPGVDGLGGGGGGGAKGGSGCVIMSFIPDEAPPANSADFSLSGGTVLATPRGVAHKFTQDGTLTVTGSGTVELLVVGGGGGGGAFTDFSGSNVAPGGGAGGLVYAASMPVTAGSYAIAVGAGGAIGANGGNSSALGHVAYGGGAGVAKSWGNDGASGGGSGNGWGNTYYEGRAGCRTDS